MSGGEPGGTWSSDTPEVIDWGPTERDLGLQWAASGEADLTIPEDMWDAADVKGTNAPATEDAPPEHRPGLYVVPPPIAVSRPDQPPQRRRLIPEAPTMAPLSGTAGQLDPAALDALVEMDGEPRPDRPAAPPRRQWRPGRSR